jgi:2-oxoglutarate ferredoxin oxidoreductase subunit gamma
MIEEVKMAGFGGQGIMFIGEILAWAALFEGKKTTWMPTYGPETRGGTANCMVVISDEEIGSPFIEYPDSLVVMNKPSLEKFGSTVKPGGLIIINKSLVDWDHSREDVEVLEIRATEIAQELGNHLVANLVMLGAYLKKKGIVSLNNITEALRNEFSEKKHLIELNEKALERGWQEAK